MNVLLVRDLRYAIRMLAKSPGFTAVAVLTLAAGIGAATTIFSAVNGVLIRPLPYEDPERIAVLWGRDTAGGYPQLPLSGPELAAFQRDSQAFEQIAAFRRSVPANVIGGDEPEQVLGVQVQADVFPLLGVQPHLGRPILPRDDLPGANPEVVVLGHGLWQRRFGADPRIVGKDFVIDGKQLTVVGVMPPGFQFPPPMSPEGIGAWVPADLWMPLNLDASGLRRGDHFLGVLTRRKAGISPEQAQTQVDVVTGRLQQRRPNSYQEGFHLVALHDQVVRNVRPSLLALLGAGLLLLLIACSNVANLLLSRAATRQREISVRVALGASRWQVIRQLLTESVLLGGMAGALGLLLASWGTALLAGLRLENIPRLDQIGIELNVLAFATGVSLVTAVLFGLAPATQALRSSLSESLRDRGRASAVDAGGRRVRSLLVVSQVALSVVLLVGAGLLIESFLYLQSVDPGFASNNVLRVEFSLPRDSRADRRVAGFRDLLERMRALPSVESAGAVSELPLGGKGGSRGFLIEGLPLDPDGGWPQADHRVITPGYLETMKIPLRQGRYFADADDEGVVIIDDVMARIYWPGENPIGKRIRFLPEEFHPWRSIVGVVGHVKHHGLGADSRVQLYVLHTEFPRASMSLVIRTTLHPLTAASAVRAETRRFDPNLPIASMQTMDAVVSDSLTPQRFNMFLSTAFAAVALLLAAMGIYGVVSYSVTQRTLEIGLRMALGAQAREVLGLVVRHGLALTVTGVAIGLIVSLGLTRFLASQLYGVTPTDTTTFVSVSFLLLAISVTACYLPARRAARVDPMVALRHE